MTEHARAIIVSKLIFSPSFLQPAAEPDVAKSDQEESSRNGYTDKIDHRGISC